MVLKHSPRVSPKTALLKGRSGGRQYLLKQQQWVTFSTQLDRQER